MRLVEEQKGFKVSVAKGRRGKSFYRVDSQLVGHTWPIRGGSGWERAVLGGKVALMTSSNKQGQPWSFLVAALRSLSSLHYFNSSILAVLFF